MSDNPKTNKPSDVKNQVNQILDELCVRNESEVIEADIISLFEDIMKLFAGREEEFLNFENLSVDAKKAIYTEIKNIIALLKQLRGAKDKDAVMQMLSRSLIDNCSKHSKSFHSISEELNTQEQKNLKRRFADAILLELHRQRQAYIADNKAPSKELNNEIAKYVEQMKSKFSSVIPKKLRRAERVADKKTTAPNIRRDF